MPLHAAFRGARPWPIKTDTDENIHMRDTSEASINRWHETAALTLISTSLIIESDVDPAACTMDLTNALLCSRPPFGTMPYHDLVMQALNDFKCARFNG